MPKPNFWKWKLRTGGRGKDTPKTQEDSKQETISKFFLPKSTPTRNEAAARESTSDVIIDDDDYDSPAASKVETAASPFRQKRSHSSTSESPSDPDAKRQRPSTSTEQDPAVPSCSYMPVCDATLLKLQSFSSSFEEGGHSETNISVADLKRAGLTNVDISEDGNNDSMDTGEDSGEDFEDGTKNPLPGPSKTQSLLAQFASAKPGTSGLQSRPGSGGSTPTRPASRGLPKKATKLKYTPLELQFIEIKDKHPDCLLFVECGYKYRFFGKDAELAARDLNIYCRLDHNFMTASIPTHRLYVHVRRLVAKGHKVGVVKQTETAALKAAGDNKTAPFTRQLTALYTKSTLIGEDVDPVFSTSQANSSNGITENTYLMCISEPRTDYSKNKPHTVAVVAVQPATGEIIYDLFEDGATRSELETRISHIQPVELLLPETLTSASEKLINQLISVSKTADDRIRVEKLPDEVFDTRTAVSSVTDFYSSESGVSSSSTSILSILKLPEPVISCLNGLLSYLREFNLHKVLCLAGNLHKFSTENSHMKLNACTVRNLELFRNQTNGGYRGSLLWVLDQTSTKFGARLLRQWLSKPLVCVETIEDRLNAVTELRDDLPPVLGKLQDIISKLPDLEKGLCTIFHKKCSTSEFLSVCKSLANLDKQLRLQLVATPVEQQVNSALLRNILAELGELLEGIGHWTGAIHQEAANDGDKTRLFVDESDFPDIVQRKAEIAEVTQELKEHRREVRLKLRIPALEYTSVLGVEFLIEVKNNNLKAVPNNWVRIGSTKAVSRFHSPFIVDAYKKLQQLREQLVIDARDAWMLFLGSFEDCYGRYRKAVQHLATLDCLFSLVKVAKQEGFCRPQIMADQRQIHIEQGRHPVVDMLLGEQEQFVPNDTKLQASGERCMVITGPNMGGKSSYIKQVALITIMAQMGSYVPAASAEIGVIDGVFTRMGASDELFKGRSTFMVELEEAADIIHTATDRSLVILDELGRGTSTHDGVAIAYATLKYFVEDVKCFTLFVTHYPLLAETEDLFPGVLANYHMAFMLQDEEVLQDTNDGNVDVLTFLYQLVRGVAARSYGLNVARLACLPADILKTASTRSQQLETAVKLRREQRTLFQRLLTASEKDIKSLLSQTGSTTS